MKEKMYNVEITISLLIPVYDESVEKAKKQAKEIVINDILNLISIDDIDANCEE